MSVSAHSLDTEEGERLRFTLMSGPLSFRALGDLLSGFIACKSGALSPNALKDIRAAIYAN